MNTRRMIKNLVPKKVIGQAKSFVRKRRARKFVRPEQIDFRSLLPAPPKDNSEQTQSELLEVLEHQQTRTPEEIQRAINEAFISPSHFAEVIGPWFDWKRVPETMKFLHELMYADGTIVEPAKAHYARKRPYEVDGRLKPCVPLENTASYPSGHAARTLILASAIAEIFPEHKEKLEGLAERIPHYRIKAGVHFPSDIAAGKILGRAIYERFKQSPAYQAGISRSREECAKNKPKAN